MVIRIVIVDDHVLLRDGISKIISGQPDFDVVGEAGTVADALEVVNKTRPDLVLMDYSLPDGNGLEGTRAILGKFPETEVVILTIHDDDDLLFEAVRSGANGYLLKNIPAKELLAKLRGVVNGEAAMMPAQTRTILSEFAKTSSNTPSTEEELAPLTERELEVLQLMVNGATNNDIAAELVISRHTVKNHVHNILGKLQVSDRREATEVAVKSRLVDVKKI